MPVSELLTARQVEELLGVRRTFVYRLLASGDIPVVRLNKLIRVRRSDLERYIEEHKAA